MVAPILLLGTEGSWRLQLGRWKALVLRIVHRVLTPLLGQAGLKADEADEADGGAVTPIQLFGFAANLIGHPHSLVLDRAHRLGSDGDTVFIECPRRPDDTLQAALQKILTRTRKLPYL